MIKSTSLFIGTLLLALLWSPAASAYVSPEQTLLQDAFQQFFSPDQIPTGRRSAAEAARQRAEYQERHGLLPAAEEEPVTPPSRTPDLGEADPGDDSPLADTSAEDRRYERLLDRLDNQGEETAFPAALGGEEVLHSGAPLSETGPGTIVAIVVAVAAILWTLRRATKGRFYVTVER